VLQPLKPESALVVKRCYSALPTTNRPCCARLLYTPIVPFPRYNRISLVHYEKRIGQVITQDDEEISYLFGEDSQICLFGGCLLIT
jgi:hypothetical protein